MSKLDELVEGARKRPPMTEEELWRQRISWAWGNDVEGTGTIEDVIFADFAMHDPRLMVLFGP